MPFAYLPENKYKVKRWIDELIACMQAEDKQKLALKQILHQRLWVSPMLSGNEVFTAFRAACRKLAKHRSVTRLRLGGDLLAALKVFRTAPRNTDSEEQSLQGQV